VHLVITVALAVITTTIQPTDGSRAAGGAGIYPSSRTSLGVHVAGLGTKLSTVLITVEAEALGATAHPGRAPDRGAPRCRLAGRSAAHPADATAGR
jgi:hypothetical protein